MESILDEMEKELASTPITKEASEKDMADEGDGTAVDIREEWTEADEAYFFSKVGPSKPVNYYAPSRAPRTSSQPPKDLPRMNPAQSVKASDSGPVKSKIVERTPRKPSSVDPSQIIIGKQAKESLFKRRLRDTNEDAEGEHGNGKETLAP